MTKLVQQEVDHRRQYPRIALEVRARLSLASDPTHVFEASVPTSNVSVGGLFLQSTFFLRMGTKLDVRLQLPDERMVHVRGVVVRVQSDDGAGPTGFALKFVEYFDGSEVALATHFLYPVASDFLKRYAKDRDLSASEKFLREMTDVLAAWELHRDELGGDVWEVSVTKK